jgi:hypothetical protein
MTPRDFGPPTRTPREHLGRRWRRRAISVVAFLFGSERYGMRNEDVYRCHVALQHPGPPDYGSLNLAAAIQVIAYEWRMALGGFAPARRHRPPRRPMPQAVAGMLRHWEQSLVDIGFLDPAAPKKLMPRLQQLFNRAQPTPEEIHILRGVAKAMPMQRKRQSLRLCGHKQKTPCSAACVRHPVHPRPRPCRPQQVGGAHVLSGPARTGAAPRRALAVEARPALAGRFISQFARWLTGIEIHPGATIGSACSSTTAWAW